jgi:hypothetical protein
VAGLLFIGALGADRGALLPRRRDVAQIVRAATALARGHTRL